MKNESENLINSIYENLKNLNSEKINLSKNELK